MSAIAFVNSDGNAQVVTDDPCPTCGYPERHQIYAADLLGLIADGCPSCETSRITDRTIRSGDDE